MIKDSLYLRSNSRKRHERHRYESYNEHREAEEGGFRQRNNSSSSKGGDGGGESHVWHQVIILSSRNTLDGVEADEC